jgi:hypothetical protein
MCRVSWVRGERGLLRVGEYLVRRACRRLPRGARDERYREWAAELPAILHDPEIRLAPRRAVRMLSYAADTVRGTARTAGRRRTRPGHRLVLAALMPWTGYAIWSIVRRPHQAGRGQAQLRR